VYDWAVMKSITPIAHGLLNLENNSSDSILENWFKTISGDFSKRQFTRFDDRLVALSGYARVFERKMGAKYVAGIWDINLAYGLGLKNWGSDPRIGTNA
jgi:hypothetical protein